MDSEQANSERDMIRSEISFANSTMFNDMFSSQKFDNQSIKTFQNPYYKEDPTYKMNQSFRGSEIDIDQSQVMSCVESELIAFDEDPTYKGYVREQNSRVLGSEAYCISEMGSRIVSNDEMMKINWNDFQSPFNIEESFISESSMHAIKVTQPPQIQSNPHYNTKSNIINAERVTDMGICKQIPIMNLKGGVNKKNCEQNIQAKKQLSLAILPKK